MTYTNEDNYTGDWMNGLRCGDGVLRTVSPDCSEYDVYEGYFYGDLRSGVGKETLADGSTYTGSWLNNTRHGDGELRAPPVREGCLGKLVYKGQWAGGAYQGLGKVNLQNGDAYKGMFLNGLFHGSGTYYQNGNKYCARWKAGKAVKKGKKVLTFTNGSTYSGLWCPVKGRYGRGVYKNNHTGCVYTGVFVNDLLSGGGKVWYPDGSVHEYSEEESLQ
jgi:hypothetical protein